MDGDRSLADGGCYTLHIARANIAHREHSGKTGFQHLWKAAEGPSGGWSGAGSRVQISSGKDETFVIEGKAAFQPVGSWGRARHQEHVPNFMG